MTSALVEFPMGIKISGQMDKKIPTNEIIVEVDLRVVPIKVLNDRYFYQLEEV